MKVKAMNVPTPYYVLRNEGQPLSPAVTLSSGGGECKTIFGFSDKVPYDDFLLKSKPGLTPYPLVKRYLQNQIDEAQNDGGSLTLVALDAAGPAENVIYAATMAAILSAHENKTEQILATHLLRLDPKSGSFQIEEIPDSTAAEPAVG